MKKILSFAPGIFCAVFSVYPICVIIAAAIHYRFYLYHMTLTYTVLAVSFLLFTLGNLLCRNTMGKIGRGFSAFLLPVVFLSEIMFFFRSGVSAFSLCTAAVSVGCAVCFFIKYANPFPLRLASGILCAMFLLFSFFLFFLHNTVGKIGEDTSVKTLPSPSGTYTAELLVRDEGALGGNTVVTVTKKDTAVSVLIGAFSEEARRVYIGPWEEAKTISLTWKNENTLVINGTEFYMEEK